MKKIKNNLDEFLLAYYVFSFVLLRRIIPNYNQISTTVLFANVSFVVIISILNNINQLKFTREEIIMYLAIMFYAIIDCHFRFNEFTYQIYIYMAIFAIVPIFLFLRVKNIDRFLNNYSIFAILVALLYIMDPMLEYKYCGDYMGFGYNVMLLAYIGVYIKTRTTKNILLKILVIVMIVETALYANKGAILSIIIFTLLYELLIRKNSIKNLFIILVSGILFFGSGFIIEQIHDIVLQNGIYSYSIETLYQMANKTSSGLSGREGIWDSARNLMNENLMFGSGAGYYRTTNIKKLYTHNIVYDVIIEYGIFIFAILLVITLKGIIKIKREKNVNNRLLGIMFLTSWFPKLLVSSYLQAEIAFWLFLIWAIVNTGNIEGEYNEDKKFNN